MSDIGKYKEYFEVDSKYWPCIDDSAIDSGAPWENTYPHEDFIDLLKNVEKMLGGSTRRSVWIHGAYGTGKSQCAHALRKIFEVSTEELTEYWNSYEPLKLQNDLLSKIIGHKDRGVIVAHRYASGDITTIREFFRCVQESVKKALIESNLEYKGENTLKESIISWIEDPTHKQMLNLILEKPEWKSAFSQNDADGILVSLRQENVKGLMGNIFNLSKKEGIDVMSLSSDNLKDWIKDIIEKNDIKILFIWDEFTDFFKSNRNSLGEFQKIIALCELIPFYFIPVTHQTDSIISEGDQSWSVVRQRFNFSEIHLPDNIAFELIGHAFTVKKEAEDTWNICADDLNSAIHNSRNAVMKEIKITNENIMKRIMPIHPMAAIVLKHIASAFQSNQRSMFNFIKNDDDSKAFQWFIGNFGPADDHPLLTIDMLWDFFYESEGKQYLSMDIRMVLDTYNQFNNLRPDEERVLKTILIMQAIDKRLGGIIPLLKPTEKNISYAFEGISSGLDISCKNIAKSLKDNGILVLNPIGNNEYAYGAAVLAGDQVRIDEYKKKIRDNCPTSTLINQGKLSTVLNMPAPLRLRYKSLEGELTPVTYTDFTRNMNNLRNLDDDSFFKAVIAFAKNENEAVTFRELIKKTVRDYNYKDIIVIDALSTPLSDENFNSYIDFEAMSHYYQGNNNNSSRENHNRAINILSSTWRNEIYKGKFTIYRYECPDGELYMEAPAVHKALESIVREKYPSCFEFNRGITENALKPSSLKAACKCGIIKNTAGAIVNLEKSVLSDVWNVDKYWIDDSTKFLNISKIKTDLDKVINDNFAQNGQISIGTLITYLQNKYGFVQSNLYAFLIGFLLKEYSGNPYRYADLDGTHENMTIDKLSEMIGNYWSKKATDTYLMRMTQEEMAFYKLTEIAWNITKDSCSSTKQAVFAIQAKMKTLGQPVWSLEEVDTYNVYEYIQKYIDILQTDEDKAHKIALNLGKAYMNRPEIANNLRNLICVDNCKIGMLNYLNSYKNGLLIDLATKNGANDLLLNDVSNLFAVDYSNLWKKNTGEDQIDKLINEYKFVSFTNDILGSFIHSKKEAYLKWKDKLNFTMCSWEGLKQKYPDCSVIIDFLYSVVLDREILPDQIKAVVDIFEYKYQTIVDYYSNENEIFYQVYKVYLDGITLDEISNLKPHLTGIFKKNKSDSNALVKQVVEQYLNEQLKNQMFLIWKTKTSSKTPREWSYIHKIPILLLVDKLDYNDAKKAFDVLNRTIYTEVEIKNTIEFLNKTNIFSRIKDSEFIDNAFKQFLGSYNKILDESYVRDKLSELTVEPYDWHDSPYVKEKIELLAKAEYEAGGAEKVISKIEKMSSDEIKSYFIKLVKENINLGVEIICKEE